MRTRFCRVGLPASCLSENVCAPAAAPKGSRRKQFCCAPRRAPGQRRRGPFRACRCFSSSLFRPPSQPPQLGGPTNAAGAGLSFLVVTVGPRFHVCGVARRHVLQIQQLHAEFDRGGGGGRLQPSGTAGLAPEPLTFIVGSSPPRGRIAGPALGVCDRGRQRLVPSIGGASCCSFVLAAVGRGRGAR